MKELIIKTNSDKIALIKLINSRKGSFKVTLAELRGSRTMPQNSALNASLRTLAETLNESGLDMRLVLKEGVMIDWTQETAKEQLFRPIMTASTGKTSTTQLSTIEMSQCWDVLQRHLGEKFAIHVPFSNREDV